MFAVTSATSVRAPVAVASAKARASSKAPAAFTQRRTAQGSSLAMGSKVSSKARASSLVVRAADAKEVPGSVAKGLGKALPMEMDIDKIMSLLPHRYPFLLVDRVLEIEQGSYAIGLKNVTINDNFFPGHFPQRPIMPGVLMVEAMAQVGAFMLLTTEVDPSLRQLRLTGLDAVRFRRPVVPGDQVLFTVEFVAAKRSIVKVRGEARVDGHLCAEAEILERAGVRRDQIGALVHTSVCRDHLEPSTSVIVHVVRTRRGWVLRISVPVTSR